MLVWNGSMCTKYREKEEEAKHFVNNFINNIIIDDVFVETFTINSNRWKNILLYEDNVIISTIALHLYTYMSGMVES